MDSLTPESQMELEKAKTNHDILETGEAALNGIELTRPDSVPAQLDNFSPEWSAQEAQRRAAEALDNPSASITQWFDKPRPAAFVSTGYPVEVVGMYKDDAGDVYAISDPIDPSEISYARSEILTLSSETEQVTQESEARPSIQEVMDGTAESPKIDLIAEESAVESTTKTPEEELAYARKEVYALPIEIQRYMGDYSSALYFADNDLLVNGRTRDGQIARDRANNILDTIIPSKLRDLAVKYHNLQYSK
jgi:hypothetical protein